MEMETPEIGYRVSMSLSLFHYGLESSKELSESLLEKYAYFIFCIK